MKTKKDLLTDAQERAESRARITANLPWIITSTIFLLILVKVLIVARLDVGTALGIVQQAGPLTLAPGIILSLFPVLGLGMGTLAVHLANNNFGEPSQRALHWVFYFIAVTLFSTFQPWSSTLIQVGIPITYVVIRRTKRFRGSRKAPAGARQVDPRQPSDEFPDSNDLITSEIVDKIREVDSRIANASPSSVDYSAINELRSRRSSLVADYNERTEALKVASKQPIELIALIFIGLLLFVAAPTYFTDATWMPAENLRTVNSGVVTGYVLSSDESWTTILTTGTRSIRSIKTSEVLSRQVCRADHDKPSKIRTVWNGHTQKPNYPECATPDA